MLVENVRACLTRHHQWPGATMCDPHTCQCVHVHIHAPQALTAHVRARCEDPASSYNFGWSHGKEALVGGRPDVHKGSYYANPVNDEVTADEDLMRRYPSYCRCSVMLRQTRDLSKGQPQVERSITPGAAVKTGGMCVVAWRGVGDCHG